MSELKKENSAFRIHRIFERMVAQTAGANTLSVLSNALQLAVQHIPK